MKHVPKWLWFVGTPLLLVILILGYWGYEYSTHSTPEKAQAIVKPSVHPFETGLTPFIWTELPFSSVISDFHFCFWLKPVFKMFPIELHWW